MADDLPLLPGHARKVLFWFIAWGSVIVLGLAGAWIGKERSRPMLEFVAVTVCVIAFAVVWVGSGFVMTYASCPECGTWMKRDEERDVFCCPGCARKWRGGAGVFSSGSSV
jgi:hypothetical protein